MKSLEGGPSDSGLELDIKTWYMSCRLESRRTFFDAPVSLPWAAFCLVLLALFQGAATAGRIPNGLCLIKGKLGGSGHGFVIGNYLFSAAHVFERGDGQVLCMQDGALVDITSRRTPNVAIHPTYLGRDATRESLGYLHRATQAFDLAMMELGSGGPEVNSEFILDPSLDIGQSAALQAPLGMASVIRLRENGSFEEFQTVHDLSAVKMEYIPALDRVSVEGRNLKEANTYLEYDMPLRHGDSGAPVFLPLKNTGKKQFLVIGVVHGDHGVLSPDPYIPHSDRVCPTLIAPTVHLATWLAKSRPHLFKQGCAESIRQMGQTAPEKPNL